MGKKSLLTVNLKKVNDFIRLVLTEIEKAAFEQGIAEEQRRATGNAFRNALAEARRRGVEQGKRAAYGRQYRCALVDAEERGFQRGLAKVGMTPSPGKTASFDDFLSECCILDGTFRVQSTAVYREFCRWWHDDSSVLTVTAFGRLMAMRFKKCKSNGRVFYQGLRMMTGHLSEEPDNSHFQQNGSEKGTNWENMPETSS